MCKTALLGTWSHIHDIFYVLTSIKLCSLADKSPRKTLELLQINLISLDLMTGRKLDKLLRLLMALILTDELMQSMILKIMFHTLTLLL